MLTLLVPRLQGGGKMPSEQESDLHSDSAINSL